ncbi:sulfotransferase 6B1-like [Denticeps clupeoides]|uniref:sulfotransferase 6B1-like n=1 Tax=Denticeps clupeoides TaxID=299321 RepID=UPI0010A3E0BE|nr:sulfotransferase 6B1-like [Denticeps clupeoides]
MGSPLSNQMMARIEAAKAVKEEDKLYRYGGVLYPVILAPEENLKALEDIEARPDDVMLVAYPKCGFNWMVAVIRKIISAATGQGREDSKPPLIEFFGPEQLQHFAQAPSPRFIGTHMHPDNIPSSFTKKKTKILVIFRNPKDTAVSYYHFSNKNPVLPSAESWDMFYKDFIAGEVAWGSYFDHVLAWEKKMDDPNVLIITYEELKQDLSKGVQRVSDFFGFNLGEDTVNSIADRSTFRAMKESSHSSHGNMGSIFFRKGVCV